MKVIDDLADMEVTPENIEQQLVFATYYAKIAKLMLKYNLACTDRSREADKTLLNRSITCPIAQPAMSLLFLGSRRSL